jgi:hypothetical protein
LDGGRHREVVSEAEHAYQNDRATHDGADGEEIHESPTLVEKLDEGVDGLRIEFHGISIEKR